MATMVWCLMASLFLVSVYGEIYDDVSQSFYEKPESSSPTPGRLTGMKEFVLYLTPEQVNFLQDAGAIVKPFPQFEKAFLQQQSQQSVEHHTEPQKPSTQPTSSGGQNKQGMDLDEFYKVFNIQQLNEDLSMQTQPDEQTTEKSRQKFKYVSKPWQQEYAALYVPKKNNKTKSYSTEYARYLPNYEFETLKLEPFRALPLAGYQFENIATNIDYQRYLQTQPLQIKSTENIQKSEEQEIYIKSQSSEEGQSNEEIEEIKIPRIEDLQKPEGNLPINTGSIRTFAIDNTQPEQVVESTLQNQSSNEHEGTVIIDAKIHEHAKVSEPINDYVPKNKHTTLEIHTHSEIQNPGITTEQVIKTSSNTDTAPITESTSAALQRQFSSLLAPLLQHDKITESIAQQREELENSEQAIKSKLKQLKESSTHDEQKYAIEVDKLNANLGKQNALAEKLVLKAISKKPQFIAKDVFEFRRRRPVELLKHVPVPVGPPVLVRTPEPLELRVPRKYPVPFELLRPIPVPVLQSENIGVVKPLPVEVEKRIPVPVTKNIYVNVEKPYSIPTVNPLQVKHELPLTYSLPQPEKLTILRHIWEH